MSTLNPTNPQQIVFTATDTTAITTNNRHHSYSPKTYLTDTRKVYQN
jgi:hypothetical protein